MIRICDPKLYPIKGIFSYNGIASASCLLVLPLLVSLCSAWNQKQVLPIAVPCQPLKILQGPAVDVATDFDHTAAATERVELYLLCHLSQMEYPWA